MRTLQLSDSQLGTAYFCARRYYYERVRRYRLVGGKPDYFQLGDVIHKMLEVFYRLQGEAEYSDRIEAAMDAGVQHASVSDEINLPGATIQFLKDTILQYADFWKDDGWEVTGSEEYFSFVLYERPDTPEEEGIRILYEGKIDLRVRNARGEEFPVDHKSSKSFRSLAHPSLLSGQFIGYAVATDSQLITENKVGLQTSYPPKKKFIRIPIRYDIKVIEEWKGWTIVKALEIDQWIQNDYYPPNQRSCRYCPFTTICFTRPEVREWKLSRDFIQVPRKARNVFERVHEERGHE